jgi:lipopolysaccharide export system protein LptA
MVPAWALAASPNEDQPILIEADSADIDDRRGVSVYRGNVEIRQGRSVLTADQVTVQHPEKKAQKIVAVGKPVKYRQTQEGGKPDIRAEALQAEYFTDSEELVMTGNAVLYQGKDSFRSDRITYDRKSGMLKGGSSAKGKRRVQVTIEAK